MTPTLTAERIALCSKLRGKSHPMSIGGSRPFNPDGPQAADTIDALHAQNAALEAGLREAGEALAESQAECRALIDAREIANAAVCGFYNE